MDASDLIRALPNSLRGAGRPHMDGAKAAAFAYCHFTMAQDNSTPPMAFIANHGSPFASVVLFLLFGGGPNYNIRYCGPPVLLLVNFPLRYTFRIT